MDGSNRQAYQPLPAQTESQGLFPLLLLGLLLLLPGSTPASAEEFRNGFDSAEPTWQVRTGGEITIPLHARAASAAMRGELGEQIVIDATSRGEVSIEHPLPASRVIEDTRLSVAVNADFAVRVDVRVVLPHQPNPRTGEDVTTFWAPGTEYENLRRWQELQCGDFPQAVARRIRFLRKQYGQSDIDGRDAYLDRVRVIGSVGAGRHAILVDELRFGPLVRAEVAAGSQQSSDSDAAGVPVEMRSGRMYVDGAPFVPRLAPFLGDDPRALRDSGFNLAWVMDHSGGVDLTALRSEGIWVAGTPPRPQTQDGRVLPPGRVSLVPFSTESLPILTWYMGTRVPSENRQATVAHVEQVMAADRKDRRPIMADVTGAEASFSRHINMLGISRHIINTSLSLRQYRDWMIQKSQQVLLGTFVWTWIQTEAAPADREWRELAGSTPLAIEPEQIRLQAYAALSAGCRGLGFWMQSPLSHDIPGALERRLAVTQLNMELELIEPWIATGHVVGHRPFTVDRRDPPQFAGTLFGIGRGTTSDREREVMLQQTRRQRMEADDPGSELQATVIQTDYGWLVLPLWYDQWAQFVPGKMAGENARIVVEVGQRDTVRAYEVNTTQVLGLRTKAVTGGLEITVPHFDQTSIIVVTSDPQWKARFEEKIAGMAERSAEVSVQLARAKLQRVEAVDRELQELNFAQPDGPRLLKQAREELQKAESALERDQYHWARFYSRNAMQSSRILQRAHWEEAVLRFSSPVSSPHTISFQTLPDHYRMLAAIGRSSYHSDENLLPSGDFEASVQVMTSDGWKRDQNDLPGIRASADLNPVRRPGSYCLSLIAVPATGVDPPSNVERPPVSVTSPPMSVHAGEIVHISGWVRVVAPPRGSLDGATLSDSITGPRGALRWSEPQEWKRFQMIREVPQDGSFFLTLTLHGLGEVQFDDIRVIPHRPKAPDFAQAPGERDADQDSSSGDLDFFKRLNKFNPLSSEP